MVLPAALEKVLAMSVGAEGVKKAFLAREEAEEWMREGREESFLLLLLLLALLFVLLG